MPITVTFDDEELSRDYTEVAVGGPVFDTGIVGNPMGVQQRAVRRVDAIRSWKIQFDGLSDTQRLALEAFFINKYGGGIGFRFYPPNDHSFVNDVIGTTTGTGSTEYSLVRKYTTAGAYRTITRRIVKPVQFSPILVIGTTAIAWKNGGSFQYPPNIPGGYSAPTSPPTYVADMNWSTGIFTFTTANGASIPTAAQVITAIGGDFDIPVFFDTDKFEASDYGVFADWGEVGLIEILPAALGIT